MTVQQALSSKRALIKSFLPANLSEEAKSAFLYLGAVDLAVVAFFCSISFLHDEAFFAEAREPDISLGSAIQFVTLLHKFSFFRFVSSEMPSMLDSGSSAGFRMMYML